MEIKVTLKPELERGHKPEDDLQLGFGKIFTDHMFTIEFNEGKWQNAQIKPFGSLTLSPAAMVLHYGQEIFEGMKAFRQEKTKGVSLFRPDRNAQRFAESARRVAMKPLPEEYFLKALHKLVGLEKHWVPNTYGTSLYIRPTEIATEPLLGLKSSKNYLFFVILSPVGPYFKEGFKPIKIYVEPEYVRAVKGGIGEAKTGGNYAASLVALQKAHDAGCSQVMWLDAIHHKFVEEVGTMNQFFVMDETIYTAPLEGTILRGVTRESVIQLAKDNGYTMKEEPLSIDEILKAIKNDHLTEAFGAGTAASIAPVGELTYQNKNYIINDFKVGHITRELYDLLTGIQYGRIKDPYGWNVPVQ
ncbi:MAG TPA: branched-chain amino acid aminotransferase [Candidatus Bathyarchaeia archaeon]|nr:branched-chain amino acid aminotransferase [Candidatus Bathyarchaeia archaeon]